VSLSISSPLPHLFRRRLRFCFLAKANKYVDGFRRHRMGRSSARALVAGHFKLSRSVRIDDSTLFLDKRKDLREKGDDVEEEEKRSVNHIEINTSISRARRMNIFGILNVRENIYIHEWNNQIPNKQLILDWINVSVSLQHIQIRIMVGLRNLVVIFISFFL